MRKITREAINLKQTSLMGLEYILVKYCFCLPLLCEDLFPLEVSCSVKHMYFTDTAALEIHSIILLTIVLHLNVHNR